MAIDLIREQSRKEALRLGFPVNDALPLLDHVQSARTSDEVLRRLLCMHAAAACAHGFDRDKAAAWLRQENLVGDLADSERSFIERGDGDPHRFIILVEGMWALAWVLGIVPRLDFGQNCDGKFATLLPNLKTAEGTVRLRDLINPRSNDEILAACDLAYCLHWSIIEAQLGNRKPPGTVQPYVIEERRRALEWLVGDKDWDKITLDT